MCNRLHHTAALAAMLLTAGLAAAVDKGPIRAVTPGGVAIEIAALEPDVYRVTVSIGAKETAPVSASLLLSGDGSSIEINSESGAIELRAWGEGSNWVLWAGNVDALPSFGRASVPGLAIEWKAQPPEHIYGLGERYDNLDQYGKRVDMWIADTPGQARRESYYCAPVLYSSRGYAFFAADNPEGALDLDSAGDGVHRYHRAGRSATFHLAAGGSLKDLVLKRGRTQGPFRAVPDWAYGPWISRNSYESQGQAEEALRGMARRGWPVAAIVQEAWKGVSETDSFNTFNPDKWPRLDDYFALCRSMAVRTILWQVPVVHPNAPSFADAAAKGYFVRKPDGSVSLRKAWLEGFANVDFTNPDAVKYWKETMRETVRLGISGFKADDGEDIKPDDVFHDGRRGWETHNEYSTLYGKALYELMDEEGVDGVLWCRSASLGCEHLPALWAGDQYATWEQYASLVPAGLSSGLSGAPFWGHDIGGYIGNPSPELYMRWLQFGAFSPMMQFHGIAPREPWEFGPAAERAYGFLAGVRMNLRPTLASLGREAAETGLPLMRPMMLEFPDDPRFAAEDTQYMLGPDLLIAPVLKEGATGRRVRFPAGRWHHLVHPASFAGPADIDVPIDAATAPVFVREGASLAVEMAKDAEWGEWRTNARARKITYAPDRAILRDLRMPTTAGVLDGEAVVEFDTGGREARFEARTAWKGTRAAPEILPFSVSDGRARVALPPPGALEAASSEQLVEIRERKADGEPRVLFRGAIRWLPAVSLSLVAEQPRVVYRGRRSVTTRIANLTGKPLSVRTVPAATRDARVTPPHRVHTLPANATVDWTWTVEFEPAGHVGDTPLRFRVLSGDRTLASATTSFTRPPNWVVAGPFPAPPRSAHRIPFPPEWSSSPDAQFKSGGRTQRWVQISREHLSSHDGVDFEDVFGETEHAAAYAMTRLLSDRARDVELRFGSDDTIAVWLNGRLLHAAETYRLAEYDQEVIPARLDRGDNTLLVKVAQDVNRWRLLFRVTGAKGAPVVGIADGFADFAAFDKTRPAGAVTIRQPRPPSWQITGPYPLLRDDPSAPGALDALAGSATWPPPVPAGWRVAEGRGGDGGTVVLHDALGRHLRCDAYAAATLSVDRPTPVELVCGSDDGLVIWVNGAKVLETAAWRSFTEDSDRVRTILSPGANRILCRIRQGSGDWQFRVIPWDLSQSPQRPLDAAP